MTEETISLKSNDIVEKDVIDDLNTDNIRILAEESRKNKHQFFQQKVALAIIVAYVIFEIILLVLGFFGRDISFFESHIERFLVLVSVVVGYYFGKSQST